MKKKEYMKFIRSLFDENHAMKFVNFEEMKNLTPKNHGIICFREIGFSSRLENLGYGGVFMSITECDLIRGVTYKRYHYDPSTFKYTIPNLVLIHRTSR